MAGQVLYRGLWVADLRIAHIFPLPSRFPVASRILWGCYRVNFYQWSILREASLKSSLLVLYKRLENINKYKFYKLILENTCWLFVLVSYSHTSSISFLGLKSHGSNVRRHLREHQAQVLHFIVEETKAQWS